MKRWSKEIKCKRCGKIKLTWYVDLCRSCYEILRREKREADKLGNGILFLIITLSILTILGILIFV